MKKYRVEIHRVSGLDHVSRCAEEILEFDRPGLTRRDWDNIVLALRYNICACYPDNVIAYIYADDHYTALASLWRDTFDSSLMHLDMVQDGKYCEIRKFLDLVREGMLLEIRKFKEA